MLDPYATIVPTFDDSDSTDHQGLGARADRLSEWAHGRSFPGLANLSPRAENHATTIHYRNGQEITRHDSTISDDGKVLTTRSRSRNREGAGEITQPAAL